MLRYAFLVVALATAPATAQTADEVRFVQGYGSMMAIALDGQCGVSLTEHGRTKAEIFSYASFAREGFSSDQAAEKVTEITASIRREWPRTRTDKKAEICRLLKAMVAGLNRVGD